MKLDFGTEQDLRTISITLDDQILAFVDRHAKKYKQSRSKVLREILHNLMAQDKNAGKE